MNEEKWSLDDLKINTYGNPRDRRPFTHYEVFVLGWLYNNTEGRTYPKMMQQCKLTLEQCETAIAGLIELDLLRLH
ncbi:MAG: hypothetical protein F6J93_16780 [Oscillatoria sp. SIO1A7]|nr:hypothetical protein [Oscillatoria sp. SIO1A7]